MLSIEKITDSWAFLPYALLNIDKIIFYFREKAISMPGIPCFLFPLPSCPNFQKIIYLQNQDEAKLQNTLKVPKKLNFLHNDIQEDWGGEEWYDSTCEFSHTDL